MASDNALIQQLLTIDTPTLSNAIEKLDARNRVSGFCNRELRYLTPELGCLCGYAVTAEVETMDPETTGGLDATFISLCEALAGAPQPTVVVLKEIGAHPDFSAHCGEVMATVFRRLGAVGLVSDSAVRDLPEVRALGFRYFAPGLVASHGSFRIVRVQIPVTICGLRITPGDLLHGDINGLIAVPEQGRYQLPKLADKVRQAEGELLKFVKSECFTVAGLKSRMVH